MSLKLSEQDDVSAALVDAVAHWVRLMTSSVGGRIEEWNGVWMCDFVSTHPHRNATVVTRQLTTAEAADLTDRLYDFYQRDHGWVVTTIHELEVGDPRLIRYPETDPIMVLSDRTRFMMPDIDDLTIKEVIDGPGVLEFERLRAEFFPVPHLQTADESELWTDAVLDDSNCLFVGYMDDIPVATGGSLATDQINEIMSLSTRPSYRRRGIAQAMMRYAIDKSDRMQCCMHFPQHAQLTNVWGFTLLDMCSTGCRKRLWKNIPVPGIADFGATTSVSTRGSTP